MLTFPDGLVGLPDLVHFDLHPVADTALVEFVSLEDASMGFIAARAEELRPGMTGDLRDRELVGESEELLVFLAVHGEPPIVTANLAGPLAVDFEQSRARQLVIEADGYGLREPVIPAP